MEWQIIVVLYGLFALLTISAVWLWTTEVHPPEWQTLLRAFIVTLFFSPVLLLLPDKTVVLPLLVVLILWVSGDVTQALMISSWVWFSLLVSWSLWFAVLFTAKNPYAKDSAIK